MLVNPKKDLSLALNGRLFKVGLWVMVAFLLLVARLGQLQIAQWNVYAREAESNRLRIERLKPPRGIILGYDGPTRGVVLADNRASRDLVFVPAECEDPELVTERLERLLGIDGAALLEEIKTNEHQPYKQIEIMQDLPRSALARVEEYSYALSGVITVARPQRRYVYGAVAGPLLGFLGEIGKDELALATDRHFMGDLVGRGGLEEFYEPMLHGRYGRMLVTQHASGRPQIRTDAYGQPYVTVDSFGHPLREESQLRQDPIPGRSLYVTLDIGLQRKAESLLEGQQGAIVVLNAATGGILTLASSPGYDPSIFVTTRMDRERYNALNDKPSRMMNRPIQEQYAPGSIFKVLLALTALEEGTITPETTAYCPGYFRLSPSGRAWRCWKRGGHGEVNVVDALAFSCDVFFYNVGLGLGVDTIADYASRVGLGEKSGLDLPGEISGSVDSRERKRVHEMALHPEDRSYWRWYDGNTLNLAIGQGGTAITPLQGAMLMSVVINGGRHVRPFLKEDRGSEISAPIFSDDSLDTVFEGMRKCVDKGPPAPSGTGHAAQVDGITILGKTGSAQVVSLSFHEAYESEEDIPYNQRDHAWFIAGVPDRDPPIAMCILIEHGHHGSSVAAPLAAELVKHYYGARPGALQVARGKGTTP